MATSYYSTGTVSLTNGSAVVTGNSTGWQLALISGGNVMVQAPGNVLPIASVDSDTQITAELQWTGATGEYTYTIQRDTAYLQSLDQNSQNLSYLLSELRAGTIFKYDQSGDLAGRDLFDARPKNFGYLVTIGVSQPVFYVKASNTDGDWAGPFPYGTGPQGPQGPVGFLDFKGTYDTATGYVANDGVLYNGSSFVALQNTTGNAPPNLPTTENAYWSLLAVKGADGAGTGDVVGPASSVDGTVPAFDGVTGKLLKGGGPPLAKLVRADVAQSFSGAEKVTLRGNLGLFIPSRNLIINPLFAVNQRQKSGTVTLAANEYGHDRMRGGASGCTYTFAVNNGVTTINITGGSLQQVIEASAFAGRPGDYFLSWAGTALGWINGGSPGVSGSVSSTCDGSSNVVVEFGIGTVALPQLERGAVGEFSTTDDAHQLLSCMRYFERLELAIYAPAPAATGGPTKYTTWYYKATKRITPTASGLGVQYAGATVGKDQLSVFSQIIDQPNIAAGATVSAEIVT